jgi:hypothetical protein
MGHPGSTARGCHDPRSGDVTAKTWTRSARARRLVRRRVDLDEVERDAEQIEGDLLAELADRGGRRRLPLLDEATGQAQPTSALVVNGEDTDVVRSLEQDAGGELCHDGRPA